MTIREVFEQRQPNGLRFKENGLTKEWEYRKPIEAEWHKFFGVWVYRESKRQEFGPNGWTPVGGCHCRLIHPIGIRFTVMIFMNREGLLWAVMPAIKSKWKRIPVIIMDSPELKDSFIEWVASVWLKAMQKWKGQLFFGGLQTHPTAFMLVKRNGDLDIPDNYVEKRQKRQAVTPAYGRGDFPTPEERRRFAIAKDGADRPTDLEPTGDDVDGDRSDQETPD